MLCGKNATVESVFATEIILNFTSLKQSMRGPQSKVPHGFKVQIVTERPSEWWLKFCMNAWNADIAKRTKKLSRGYDHIYLIFAECGGYLNLAKGRITSPGYPSSSQSQYCSWRITAPSGRRVTFNITDFDLEVKQGSFSPNLLVIEIFTNKSFQGNGYWWITQAHIKNFFPDLQRLLVPVEAGSVKWNCVKRNRHLVNRQ